MIKSTIGGGYLSHRDVMQMAIQRCSGGIGSWVRIPLSRQIRGCGGMVDTHGLGPCASDSVGVRVPSSVQNFNGRQAYNNQNLFTMDKEKIIESCKSSLTMAEAAKKAGIPHMTFKRYAIQLGVYKPNQAGIGTYRPITPLEDVFSGKAKMRSYNVKSRLIREGYKDGKCEECHLDEWNGKSLVMELHHKDGNNKNSKLENLQILCPNCHSQTPTFRRQTKQQ